MIEILLLLPIVLLIWMYGGYPLTLLLISKIKKDQFVAKPIEPNVSVVICTHNESSVIDRKIENILVQDYPKKKLEVIVVDSSTDSTADMVRERWMKDVILLKQNERRGKASAINLALRNTSGEIIILSDAPTLYSRETIKRIVGNFGDPKVGGVTGRYNPIGEGKRVEGEEILFWKFKNILKNLEGVVDSTTFFSGDLCAFRKELIEKVDNDSLADDVNIAIKIRRSGHKAICDPLAQIFEMAPDNYKDLLTSKVRRAIGGIQETIRFKDAIFNPKFGLFGMLIFPTRFMYTVLNPFIFLSCLIIAVYLFAYLLFNFYSIVLLFLLCLFLVAFRNSSPTKALTLFLITQLIQIQALVEYLIKKPSVKWEQIKSTRRGGKGLTNDA